MKNKEEINYIDCYLKIDSNNDLRIYYDNYTERFLNFEKNFEYPYSDIYADLNRNIMEEIEDDYKTKLMLQNFDKETLNKLLREYLDSSEYREDCLKKGQQVIDNRECYAYYYPNYAYEFNDDFGSIYSSKYYYHIDFSNEDNPLFKIYVKRIKDIYNIIVLPAPESYSDVCKIADQGEERDVDADYLDEIKENYLKTIKEENYIYIGNEYNTDLKNENKLLKKIKFMMNESNFKKQKG